MLNKVQARPCLTIFLSRHFDNLVKRTGSSYATDGSGVEVSGIQYKSAEVPKEIGNQDSVIGDVEVTMRPKMSTNQPLPTHKVSFFTRPSTKVGWWSGGLLAFFVCLIATSAVISTRWQDGSWRLLIMPFFGVGTVLCGLATGVLALLAVTRHHERSWLVWLPLFVGASLVFLLLGEFLIPST